jgi:hypothetical protein
LMLTFALVRSELEYTCVALNFTAAPDFNIRECMHTQFAIFRHNLFFQSITISLIIIIYWVKPSGTIHQASPFKCFVSNNVYNAAKSCCSVLETVGIRGPAKDIRNFPVLSCSSS